jgi:hypothetical protein
MFVFPSNPGSIHWKRDSFQSKTACFNPKCFSFFSNSDYVLEVPYSFMGCFSPSTDQLGLHVTKSVDIDPCWVKDLSINGISNMLLKTDMIFWVVSQKFHILCSALKYVYMQELHILSWCSPAECNQRNDIHSSRHSGMCWSITFFQYSTIGYLHQSRIFSAAELNIFFTVQLSMFHRIFENNSIGHLESSILHKVPPSQQCNHGRVSF